MLATVSINFIIGTFGSLTIFLITTIFAGETKFSAPFFVVAIGIICAVFSMMFGYMSTWIILGIFAALGIKENW